ncbi:phage holin family protein [Robiginitalea sp. M366]|uniref:phage holin family protein n=1 Tax=Robiginitalea aestuariiviva TaxID=3036903 RepID=UPI00240E0E83|nr:phage holin family protein [Robiginitalea aestuariiviva]MDG1570947.1 phage holin family protein [Robiginitalea aestuariiviva]
MKTVLRLLLTALAVVVLSNLLSGVSVDSYWIAVLVAVVLSLLNFLVKPLLILLTLPVTIVTLGLFLLIINALIILMADGLIGGFHVDGLWSALIFSLLLSLFQAVLFSFLKEEKA